ncbi:MAG: acyl-CoA dehydrogenase family protein [Myxococcota bacterium]
MDLRPSELQAELRQAARAFLEQECPVAHVRAMADDPRGYAPELWAQLAELGWLGLALPEDHGGGGCSFADLAVLIEAQGRHLLPSPFVPTVALAADAIARFGSDEQRQRLLPAIVAGEHVVAVTARGWGPPDVAVRDGALHGTAPLVPWAHVADTVLVVARDGEGVTVALVPADRVQAQPVQTVGRDARADVALDGVALPDDAVLGRRGEGQRVADLLAQRGAAAGCAAMVGACERVLELTVGYAKEREAFGKPIGTLQAIQHHCAEMAVDLLGARGVTGEACWALDAAPHAEETARTVSVAKAWVSDAAARIVAKGHQVHGAIGFTAEHDLPPVRAPGPGRGARPRRRRVAPRPGGGLAGALSGSKPTIQVGCVDDSGQPSRRSAAPLMVPPSPKAGSRAGPGPGQQDHSSASRLPFSAK